MFYSGIALLDLASTDKLEAYTQQSGLVAGRAVSLSTVDRSSLPWAGNWYRRLFLAVWLYSRENIRDQCHSQLAYRPIDLRFFRCPPALVARFISGLTPVQKFPHLRVAYASFVGRSEVIEPGYARHHLPLSLHVSDL
jgi:hypothetical protein